MDKDISPPLPVADHGTRQGDCRKFRRFAAPALFAIQLTAGMRAFATFWRNATASVVTAASAGVAWYVRLIW